VLERKHIAFSGCLLIAPTAPMQNNSCAAVRPICFSHFGQKVPALAREESKKSL
jgi:hypothetical protein